MLGIIVAMAEELEQISRIVENRQEQVIGQLKFYLASIAKQRLVLALAGIGKANAALTTAIMINRFGCESIVNLGTAGALQNNLAIGDLVLATDLAYADVDLTAFEYEWGQIPGLPARFKTSPRLNKKLELSLEQFRPKGHKGLILSADTFLQKNEQLSWIQSKFPEALAIEMEGAAIAQTALRLGSEFAVVRTISDKVLDANNSSDFSRFIREYSNDTRISELVRTFLSS